MKSRFSRACRWCAAALLLIPGQPACALLVVPPGTVQNTMQPADNPGWLNVGNLGVYIGNRWVLTAKHVGTNAITFPGIGGTETFQHEPGSGVPIDNPPGATFPTADLWLYRLVHDPGLPWLTLSSATPSMGSPVVLIGDGRAGMSGDMETHWDASWNEVSEAQGVHHGYKSTTSQKLWGTNQVESNGPLVANSTQTSTTTISFFTQFDKTGLTSGTPTASEAQALTGDSGSAIFYKNGSNWEFAGLTFAVHEEPGQPNSTFNAVFGNLTIAGDLSFPFYRNQILQITGIPELGSFWLLSGVAALVGAAGLSGGARSRRHT